MPWGREQVHPRNTPPLFLAQTEGKCAFCRKSSTDVGLLLQSDSGVMICGDCIALSQRIIEMETKRRAATKQSRRSIPWDGALLIVGWILLVVLIVVGVILYCLLTISDSVIH